MRTRRPSWASVCWGCCLFMLAACGGSGSGKAGAGGALSGGTGGGPGAGGTSGGAGGVVSGAAGVGGASGGAGTGAAGSGQAGGGGSAAGTGGGAGGPVDVPVGSTCSGARVTGQLVAAKAPAVLAARLSNSVVLDNTNIAIVPTSAMDTAYVSFYYSEHLTKIAPSGVSDEATGVCGHSVATVVDGTDSPALFAQTEAPGASNTFDEFYSFWTRAQPAWSADFVAKAVAIPGGYGLIDGYLGVGAFIGSAGQARALVFGTASSGLSIYDRRAPGRWIGSPVATYGYYPIAVLDSLGRQRIVYSTLDTATHFHYHEWIDGKTIEDFRQDGRSNIFAAAAGPSGTLAVARVTTDGVVVTFSDGATVGGDHLVPGTTLPSGEAPCYTKLATCQPTVCKSEGIDGTFALASTSDGTLWLAYRYAHRTDEYTVNGTDLRYCWTLSKSSATVDLRLVRLSPNGSSAPSTSWSYSTSGSDVDQRPFGMAARGSRLFLAIANHDTADVFVVDSTKL